MIRNLPNSNTTKGSAAMLAAVRMMEERAMAWSPLFPSVLAYGTVEAYLRMAEKHPAHAMEPHFRALKALFAAVARCKCASDQRVYASDHCVSASDQRVYASDQRVYASDQCVYASDHRLCASDQCVYASDQCVYASDRCVCASDQCVYASDQRVYASDQRVYASDQWVSAAKSYKVPVRRPCGSGRSPPCSGLPER